ncbi:DHA2 family efflux MFS transporter permease subunit [Galbitalea sp. SE-J8]|uniref:DHA2 family efflux MFS transporter permease subunit n=1 Tax=Galbitalea sp. SE-J8 TaxID=3054952 RepID=UPI00259CAA71|nr:DHA2 family efflux MFS transporter permease subunit [Galbitalea sp. SE-J8]MDM4764211.1 DHA2 family efflux MFS transporter permease subunit [Galbitalea sp. SE-J8]
MSQTAPTASIPIQDGAAASTAARNRLAITILLVSTFVVILNETIMSVALPTLKQDLQISESAGQWLTTAFLLTTAVVIPITGWLLLRFSTRPVFIAAMALFTAGTAIAAIAPGFTVLLVGRVVQASGTAIMMPLLFTTVLTLVPEASRGRVMGNISIVISVAPALGPTISGVVLQTLGWRWMFIVVLPFAIAALVLGAARIPNVNEPGRAPLDVPSVVISAFTFGGLVYGLSEAGLVSSGQAPASLVVGPLVVAVIALVLFIGRQLRLQRTDAALLDLRTFRSRTFAVSMGMAVVAMMSMFGALVLLPLYLGYVLRVPEIVIGLAVLPGGLVLGLLAPFVGRLYDRVGPRPLVIAGSIAASSALWLMATLLGLDSPLALVVGLHVLLFVGLALMFTPLFTAGLGSIPPHLYSHGSAILGTIQQVAGAAGVAVFVTVLAGFAGDTSHGVADVATYAQGINAAFLVGAVLSIATIVLAFFLKRPVPAEGGAPVVAH